MTRPSFFGLILDRARPGDDRGAVSLSSRLLADVGLHGAGRRACRSTHFEKAIELYSTDILFTLFIVIVSTLLTALFSDRHRRDADPRRNALADLVAALPLSLAALHPVHRRGSMHAHVPGQERPDEQFAGGAGHPGAACKPRAFSIGAASSSRSCGNRCRSSR